MSRLPYIQYGGKQLRELEKDMKSMNLGVIFSEGTKRAMRYDLVFVCSTCDVHVLTVKPVFAGWSGLNQLHP